MALARRFFLLLLSLVCLASTVWSDRAPDYADSFRQLAVQQGGRLKPFDTFARESVRFVTGKAEFNRRDPVHTMLWWWGMGAEGVRNQKVIEFRNTEWKKKLGLAAGQRYFSLAELDKNPEFAKVDEQLHRMKEGDKVPSELAPAQDLMGKMHTLQALAAGSNWNMVPPPQDLHDAWASLQQAEQAGSPLKPQIDGLRKALTDTASYPNGEHEKLIAIKVTEFETKVRSLGAYPSARAMAREVHYNKFHPFRKAWVLYLFSFICLFLTVSRGPLYWAGVCSAGFGIAFHAYGFYLRCMIAGRAPVTNMYESVIWVAFGAVAFALIFEALYRGRAYLMAACAGSVICLVLADQLPTVLDPSIRPLMPVLRSNYWLTIHVLTITLGYAAFLLALGLGHMVLWKYLTAPEKLEELGQLNTALYRAMQVGVLLLAAGTMLGGVWAYYSWGRFWGWDPKEVWALIALLGYLAILHARVIGMIGHFGTAAWSVLSFQGVVMAWYGVNFVLGAGLHSYGFGNGGVQYVGVYSALEVAFVLFVTWRVRGRKLSSARHTGLSAPRE